MQIAECGFTTLPGQVSRVGDALKHLGPPRQIPSWSKLFSTRCGLSTTDGPWSYTEDVDDNWCPECLIQGGIAYSLVEI